MSGKPNKPAGGPPMGGPGHGPGGRHARAMGGKPKETKQTIKRLLGYLGKDKKHVIIALVCVVISSLSTLAGSYMLSPIINGITETYDKASKAAGDAGIIINEGLKTLGLGILLMLAIYGIGVISMYLQQRIMIGVSQRALMTLRKDLFDHIQTLPRPKSGTHEKHRNVNVAFFTLHPILFFFRISFTDRFHVQSQNIICRYLKFLRCPNQNIAADGLCFSI